MKVVVFSPNRGGAVIEYYGKYTVGYGAGRGSRPGHRPCLHLTGPTVPDPLPARGRVRCHHVSQRWKMLSTCGHGPGPRSWVRDLHVPSGLQRALSSASCSGGVRSRHVSRRRGRGRKPSAGSSHTHRIQCGWLRRALPPRHVGQLLSGLTVDRILPRYKCSRMRRICAEPVCRIK